MLNYARDDLGTALGRESISFQSTVSELNEYRIRSQCHLSEHPKKKHEKRIKLFSLFLMSSKQSIKNGKKEKCLSQCMWRCRQKVFPNKEEIVENLKDGMPIFPIHNLVFFSAMLVLHPNLIWLWTNYCLQLRTNARCKQTRLRSSSLMRCDAMHSVHLLLLLGTLKIMHFSKCIASINWDDGVYLIDNIKVDDQKARLWLYQ